MNTVQSVSVGMATFGLALSLCLYFSIASRAQQTVAVVPETPAATLSVLLVGPPLTGHLIPLLRLGKELAVRGHNVSLCTTEVAGHKSPLGIAEKHGVSFISAGQDPMKKEDLDGWTISARHVSTLRSIFIAQSMLAQSHRAIVCFLDRPSYNQWDIAVFDFILELGGMYLSAKWDVPVIFNLGTCAFNPFLLPEWPFPVVSSGYTDNMTFTERLINTAVVLPVVVVLKVFLVIHVKVTVGVSPSPSSWALLKYGMGVSSPLLVNTAFGMEFARSRSSLTHYVGPLLKPEMISEEELPPFVSQWLEEQPNRKVVYISMGSFVHLTPSIAEAIMDGISLANYSAIWALGASSKEIVEKQINGRHVLLIDWAPQLTLLSHPLVKLAVLHCGFGGVQEAIYVEVPLICLPHGFDHQDTAARVTYHGVGISLDPKTLTSDQIVSGIGTIETGSYSMQMKRLSKIFVHAGGLTKAARLVEFYQQTWPLVTNVMTSCEPCYASVSFAVLLIVMLYLLTTRYC